MKKILVNYADKTFSQAQKLNTKTGLEIGGFDDVRSFAPEDIDEKFYTENKGLLNEFRGNGYWLWKPYFLHKVLTEANEGDFVFYCDSGAVFVDTIDYFVDVSNTMKQDVLVFEIPYLEKEWTKRDTFILMDCDDKEYRESLQRMGTFILCKKSKKSLNFVSQWLDYAKDTRIITNLENQMGISNYEGFKEHRHDQSILSLLSKKYHLTAFRDPSQFGNEFMDQYKNSPYPQIVESTRKRNISTRIVHKIKRMLGQDVYKRFSFDALFKIWFKHDKNKG